MLFKIEFNFVLLNFNKLLITLPTNQIAKLPFKNYMYVSEV